MVRQKSTPPKNVCVFLSNRLEFQSDVLPTYLVILCTHNGIITIQLAYGYYEAISFTVSPLSDFSVLENFGTKIHS